MDRQVALRVVQLMDELRGNHDAMDQVGKSIASYFAQSQGKRDGKQVGFSEADLFAGLSRSSHAEERADIIEIALYNTVSTADGRIIVGDRDMAGRIADVLAKNRQIIAIMGAAHVYGVTQHLKESGIGTIPYMSDAVKRRYEQGSFIVRPVTEQQTEVKAVQQQPLKISQEQQLPATINTSTLSQQQQEQQSVPPVATTRTGSTIAVNGSSPQNQAEDEPPQQKLPSSTITTAALSSQQPRQLSQKEECVWIVIDPYIKVSDQEEARQMITQTVDGFGGDEKNKYQFLDKLEANILGSVAAKQKPDSDESALPPQKVSISIKELEQYIGETSEELNKGQALSLSVTPEPETPQQQQFKPH
jgi:hypothetical protein